MTTTISGGAHTHHELQSGIETTQAMLAQVLDEQATILDTLNAQARMQADISELQMSVGEMKTAIRRIADNRRGSGARPGGGTGGCGAVGGARFVGEVIALNSVRSP